jgi:hypothetical protein
MWKFHIEVAIRFVPLWCPLRKTTFPKKEFLVRDERRARAKVGIICTREILPDA